MDTSNSGWLAASAQAVFVMITALVAHIFRDGQRRQDRVIEKNSIEIERCSEITHDLELGWLRTFDEHQKEERRISEQRRLEIKRDFKDLYKKVESGQQEILARISELRQ